MTQKELYDQRLLREAEQAAIRMKTRRHFIKESAMGLGALALGSFLQSCGRSDSSAGNEISFDPAHPLLPKMPPFPGKAKSVIYLHMAGAPSQLELFVYKTELIKMDGQASPPPLLEGKRFIFFPYISMSIGALVTIV